MTNFDKKNIINQNRVKRINTIDILKVLTIIRY